jgi:hypothetical protein
MVLGGSTIHLIRPFRVWLMQYSHGATIRFFWHPSPHSHIQVLSDPLRHMRYPQDHVQTKARPVDRPVDAQYHSGRRLSACSHQASISEALPKAIHEVIRTLKDKISTVELVKSALARSRAVKWPVPLSIFFRAWWECVSDPVGFVRAIRFCASLLLRATKRYVTGDNFISPY